jgi:hypothetical protein
LDYIERSMNQAIAMHTANVSCTEEEIEELDEKARRIFLKTGHYEPKHSWGGYVAYFH